MWNSKTSKIQKKSLIVTKKIIFENLLSHINGA
jgi:hypothetical protein